MRTTCCRVAIVAALASTLAHCREAFGQSSSRSHVPVVQAAKEHYAMLRRYPEIDGRIMDVARGQITLRVTYTHKVLTNGQNSLNEIDRSISQLQHTRMRSPAHAAQANQRVQQTIARNIKTVKEAIDFVLPVATDAVLRKLAKDVEFDDKGFPKPRNAPDSRGEVGYAATTADLVSGSMVKVRFQNRSGPVPLPAGPKFIGLGTPPSPPPNDGAANRTDRHHHGPVRLPTDRPKKLNSST